MSEMGPNHEALPPLKLQDIDSIIQSTAEDTLPQVPQTKHLRVLPLQQALGTTPNPVPISNHKALRSRADWVNAMFADISGQLRRHSVISTLLFEGILLQKKTVTGSLILKELRSKYDQLGHDRNVATVRVLVPEKAMGEEWQLLWTIKRQRDPNGRRFHSQSTIDPINRQGHLELDTDPGLSFLGATFLLPPFIQDYGPGPSCFDPDPEDEFDAVMQAIMTDVDKEMCKE